MKRVVITGSSGLIGSEAVAFFDERGWQVDGIDNNMRRDFFGPDGDTTPNLKQLLGRVKHFNHHAFDIRDRQGVFALIQEKRPQLLIHCAAQPSHDLAKDRPFDDFEINAVGTLNLLEAARQWCPESPFIHMSSNKVYGDAPNELPLVELTKRYDYERREDQEGISEDCRIDRCLHSLFGASKVAADVLVQEYGRYFNMPTVCFRAGCLTGASHAAAEQHGFLAYLVKAIVTGRTYHIYGYKGKQVRDNIHAFDVCTAFLAFYEHPRIAAVYNLGGGRANSISVLEAIEQLERLSDCRAKTSYVDQARIGDHQCYISNLKRLKTDYPSWDITRSLENILKEMVEKAQKALPCMSPS
ncbi:MAG: NAD-dependent epimerase/dehydratase family protein [Candidatus Omnitrophica bacterium]|nr:NAD-dependent epimerase/dehydratase family protein [Candidatus Omnitrophota bacterium]MBI3010542.1 NAD-dependent epimerase/dehydratase family protein [Candidatus Omnitrophota bacterium]